MASLPILLTLMYPFLYSPFLESPISPFNKGRMKLSLTILLWIYDTASCNIDIVLLINPRAIDKPGQLMMIFLLLTFLKFVSIF